MNIEELREYCLSKKGATEDTPFGPEILVFRLVNKIFALTNLESTDLRVNLKCEPSYAMELREKYDFILPGYHMNKKHWNTILIEKAPQNLIKSLIDHSYAQIYESLSNKEKIYLSN
ncbi:MAG: MmcQ/YjbR family DNA-binding protein [Bacteroidota bacterium]